MTQPVRKPTLSVLTIFVAAMALGFAAIRDVLPGALHILPTSPSVRSSIPHPMLEGSILILASWPLPAMATVALLLLIRLRAPRPTLRRLARQPGDVACLAAAVVGLSHALIHLAFFLKIGDSTDLRSTTVIPIGVAVSSTWSTFLAGGRWKTQHDLSDRPGRVFGCHWIAMLPLRPPRVHRPTPLSHFPRR